MPLLSSTHSCQACTVFLTAASLHVCVFFSLQGFGGKICLNSEDQMALNMQIWLSGLWQRAVLQGLINVSENPSNLCDSSILRSNLRWVVLRRRKLNWEVPGLGSFTGKIKFYILYWTTFVSSKLIHVIVFINYLGHIFMLNSIEVPSSRLPWRLNNVSAGERPACIKF